MLPTAKSISKEITACKTVEEFNSVVPCISGSSHINVEKCKTVEELKSTVSGSDGGDLFVDGTHCKVQCPSEKTLRRMRYSGKKKTYSPTDKVHLTVVAPDFNLNSEKIDEIGQNPRSMIQIQTGADRLEKYKLVETGPRHRDICRRITNCSN